MSPADAPPDIDATQGAHFRRILGKPVTWILGGSVAVAVLIAAGLGAGAAIGLGGAAAVLVLTVGIAWLIANSMAKRDFFNSYASARGLAWRNGHSPLPPATPLLRKGNDRYAEETFTGKLPGGREGLLALYTYVDESSDGKGGSEKTYYGFTVVLMDVSSTASFLQRLYCQQRHGFRFLDSAEDAFRKSQRVEVESDAVDRNYEIFAGEHDDMNHVRQLLEPSFEVWLAEHAPKDFAFELEAGGLCCSVKGHCKSAAGLDALCEAGEVVAKRALEEAAE